MQSVVKESVKLFRHHFGDHGDIHIGWSPGRVNLIGEYTDLNNGLVMPMAIDLGICIALRARSKPGYTVFAEAYQETAVVAGSSVNFNDTPRWARYIAGAAVLHQEAGCEFQGFDIVVHGNLPSDGGLSSSAALTTASSMAIQSATAWHLAPLETAKLCQSVEHRFAGVLCGVMDPMACRMGQAGSALYIDCATSESVHLPIDLQKISVLIIDSGVERSLLASDYNARRAECEAAVKALCSLGCAVKDLSNLSQNTLSDVETRLDPVLAKRCRHVVTENERVSSARRALEQGDYVRFGQLMIESHQSLRDDFEVSVAELDHIVASARDCEGVFGARLTGAGFGGNAIAIVNPDHALAAEISIRNSFADRFGRTPRVHRVGQPTEAWGGQYT